MSGGTDAQNDLDQKKHLVLTFGFKGALSRFRSHNIFGCIYFKQDQLGRRNWF